MDVKKNNFNSLFGEIENFEDTDSTMININSLVPYHDSQYITPYTDEMLQELANSIETVGQLSPILVREHKEINGKYEILSGHNRVKACEKLNIKQIHTRIFNDLSEDEAKLVVIETNLNQYNLSNYKPSIRASIVFERYEIMKKQGFRSDLLDVIEDKKDNKTKKMAGFHLGSTQIKNYVRIHEHLIDELKEKLDLEKLAMKICLQLSFLSHENQKIVNQYVENKNKMTENKAKIIRSEEEKVKNFTLEHLEELFEEREDANKGKNIKIPSKIISMYFENTEDKEIAETIVAALNSYFGN